jgi:Zn-dependent peptidase ImmA (M78 family)
LYNHLKSKRRQAFTLSHEVGHILLGHEADGDLQEKEANCFAAQLLAPLILVHELKRRCPWRLTPEDLCGVFFLSKQAAENRLRELAFSHRFTDEDMALLAKYAHLLPHIDEPIVSI